jgi:HAD superfamily hydrolase (TIGR01549 family)
MKNQLVIYDFDGVLVNSRRAVFLYYDAVFEYFNLKKIDWCDNEVMAKIMGMSFKQLMQECVPTELHEEVLNYRPSFTIEEMAAATPLEPEVNFVIPELAETAHLSICTNRDSSLNEILQYYDLKKYFPLVVTSLDVQAKPSPDGLNKIVKHYGIEKVIYVGDSDVDLMAAEAANVPFLAYKTKLGDSSIITKHSEIFSYLHI